MEKLPLFFIFFSIALVAVGGFIALGFVLNTSPGTELTGQNISTKANYTNSSFTIPETPFVNQSSLGSGNISDEEIQEDSLEPGADGVEIPQETGEGESEVPSSETEPEEDSDDEGSGEDRPPKDYSTPPSEFSGESTGSVIVGRPTDTSIAVNILASEGMDAYVEYGLSSGVYSKKTSTFSSSGGDPIEIEITGLSGNKEYYYRVNYREEGESSFSYGEEFSFHTARASGSTFTFGVQGDSHPEREGKMYSPDLYSRTMANVLQDEPDFYFTLGDDFSIEKLIEDDKVSEESVDDVYLLQREFLGRVGSSAPLFLVNGNHEQAAKYLLDGTTDNPAVLAANSRIKYYPLPAPDDFYSGDSEEVENVGLLRDYYAFEWGDALFVVIDPYWHSDVPVDNIAGNENKTSKKNTDLWNITLGDEQYAWFKDTLENSDAKYKFVFTHHVLGTGRGGVENAELCEWGGYGKSGTWEFDKKRPTWDEPIQELMAANNVSVFFQGHDHLFAYQELDGVVYQSVPNPADDTYTAFNEDAYLSGDTLPNSGHLSIEVSPDRATITYVRSFISGDGENGDIAYTYYVLPSSSQGGSVEEPEEEPEEEPDTTFGNDFGSTLLGVPTEDSIILNLIPNSDVSAYIEYGVDSDSLSSQTEILSLDAGKPVDIVLEGLSSNSEYFYQIKYSSGSTSKSTDVRSFHTARPSGSSFTFAIEADPHLDGNSLPEIFNQTLQQIISDKPDFLLDLGDTFMCEKLSEKTYSNMEDRYILYRGFFDELDGSVPLFLVNGNHEGEAGWERDGTSENIAIWATELRKEYYPGPVPDGFYTGDSTEYQYVGLRESYYAFEWGDALFVVLDPYWNTEVKPNSDLWEWTLGEEQYSWLKETLENSDAKHKFVFAHNLVGGNGKDARGGANAAPYYEWGGDNLDGSYGFDTERPGWGTPIHQLLVDNGVDVFFHGHDHMYAKEELDGVIYQEIPQPSHAGTSLNTNNVADYGYSGAETIGGSGYMRVSVTPSVATVEFVRYDGTVAASYEV